MISWLDRITRLNQEEISPRMDATNLTVLIAQAVEQCSRIWPGQRIVFAGRESFFKVFGDGELIRLALSQLLDQACKFAEPGSAVQVEIEALGGAVVVRVSIEGNGIPYHDLDHVFERSYLGSRAPSFATGSGLGLYVGRKIAVAHGGTLDFDAERTGSDCVVFRLSLPRANGQLDEQ